MPKIFSLLVSILMLITVGIFAFTPLASAYPNISTIPGSSGSVVATPSLQAVTNVGSNTTNSITFANGTSTGSFDVGTQLAAGSDATIATYNIHDLSASMSGTLPVDGSNETRGIKADFNFTPSANYTGFVGGLDMGVFYNGTTTANNVYGATFSGSHEGSGIVAKLQGGNFYANNDGAGTSTVAEGAYYSAGTFGDGGILNAHGAEYQLGTLGNGPDTIATGSSILIDTPVVLGGPISKNYGLFLQDQRVATNSNFSIYSAGGDVTFQNATMTVGGNILAPTTGKLDFGHHAIGDPSVQDAWAIRLYDSTGGGAYSASDYGLGMNAGEIWINSGNMVGLRSAGIQIAKAELFDFSPGSNNTIDLGLPDDSWKDFYASGTIYTTNLNVNGSSVSPNLTASTISFGNAALTLGGCTSTVTSVPNAATSMSVVATPVTYPGDGAFWKSYVSSAGNVTTKVCEVLTATPTASVYNIRVIQ